MLKKSRIYFLSLGLCKIAWNKIYGAKNSVSKMNIIITSNDEKLAVKNKNWKHEESIRHRKRKKGGERKDRRRERNEK